MSSRAVVVAHRQRIVAEGLAAALSSYPWLAPVGVATDAVSAERMGERADAVALDAELPGVTGVANGLWRSGVRVVFMGDSPGDDEGVRVSPDSPVSALAAALAPGREQPKPLPLSSRQRHVLRLIARGLTARQIARELGISEKTVEQHKSRIFHKLGVPNQAAAVRVAVSCGLERSLT